MDRLAKKDQYGKYYVVDEIISLIGGGKVNPIRFWIEGNENRAYGEPINRLGQLEEEKDLLEKKLGCSLETAVDILLALKAHMAIDFDLYDDGDDCGAFEYVDFNGEGLQFKDTESEKKVIDWLKGGERR